MGIHFIVYKGSPDGTIKQDTTSRPELTGDQVLVSVTASGVCGTDVHYRSAGCVLGHEGSSVVRKVGPLVKSLKPGDRVGWGYEHDSCGHCEQCLKGAETYCPDRALYGSATCDQGSFATQAVWREAFLHKIPDDISDEHAAPLMCGGATVFNVLHTFGVQPTSRIGVIGVGGLGHLAIQFAAKMGCQVVVFSGSDSKKDEAAKLGASEFYATKGAKDLKIGRLIDALLVTTSAQPDWELFLPLMAPGGTIFPISVSMDNFTMPYTPLLLNGLRIQGSLVAPRYVHRRMLDFAAHHGIRPMINRFTLDENGITEAFNTLAEGKMRYRGVLTPATIV